VRRSGRGRRRPTRGAGLNRGAADETGRERGVPDEMHGTVRRQQPVDGGHPDDVREADAEGKRTRRHAREPRERRTENERDEPDERQRDGIADDGREPRPVDRTGRPERDACEEGEGHTRRNRAERGGHG